jgi:hypothetical protein
VPLVAPPSIWSIVGVSGVTVEFSLPNVVLGTSWAKALSPHEAINTPAITRELTPISRHLTCIQIEVTLVYSLENVAISNPRFTGYKIEGFAEV